MNIRDQLRSIMERGNLTIADLSLWLERPHSTISSWVRNTREPRGTLLDRRWLRSQLNDLDRRIKHERGFPIPVGMPERERKKLIKELIREKELVQRTAYRNPTVEW